MVPSPSGVLVVSFLLINGFDFVSGSKLTYALKREKHKIHCGNENLPDSLQLGKVRLRNEIAGKRQSLF